MDERHTGRLHVDEFWLAQLLALPEGTRILHLSTSCDPPMVVLVVEHDDLPVTPSHTQSPTVGLHKVVECDEHGRQRVVSTSWSDSAFSASTTIVDPTQTTAD